MFLELKSESPSIFWIRIKTKASRIWHRIDVAFYLNLSADRTSESRSSFQETTKTVCGFKIHRIIERTMEQGAFSATRNYHSIASVTCCEGETLAFREIIRCFSIFIFFIGSLGNDLRDRDVVSMSVTLTGSAEERLPWRISRLIHPSCNGNKEKEQWVERESTKKRERKLSV